jgi:hypothetical protein
MKENAIVVGNHSMERFDRNSTVVIRSVRPKAESPQATETPRSFEQLTLQITVDNIKLLTRDSAIKFFVLWVLYQISSRATAWLTACSRTMVPRGGQIARI